MTDSTMIKFILYIVGVICSYYTIAKSIYKEKVVGLTLGDLLLALFISVGSWITFLLFISDKILVIKKNNKKK